MFFDVIYGLFFILFGLYLVLSYVKNMKRIWKIEVFFGIYVVYINVYKI